MLETELLDKLKELNIGKLTNVKKKSLLLFFHIPLSHLINRLIPNTLLLFRTLTEAPYNMYRVNLFPLNVCFLQWA